MRIDHPNSISPGAGHEIYRNQGLQQPPEAEPTPQENRSSKTDRVEISAEAQRLLERQRVADAPGEADQSGFTVEALSRTLVEAGIVNDRERAGNIAQRVIANVEKQPELNENRLQEIREKLSNRFYESPQVAEEVALRIQQEMTS